MIEQNQVTDRNTRELARLRRYLVILTVVLGAGLVVRIVLAPSSAVGER